MNKTKIKIIKYLDLDLSQKLILEKYPSLEFEKELLLTYQGENIRFLDNSQISASMRAFDILRFSCSEIIYNFKDYNFVIFKDHLEKFLSEINVVTLNDLFDLDINKIGKYSKTLEIDIDKILAKIKTKDILKQLEKFILLVKKNLKPCEVAILKGNSSPLFFLITQILLYGLSGSLFYEKYDSKELIKIY